MNQKLIDKIKKLLALSSSPVPAEAELALSKAKQLMEEYGVSIIEDNTEEIIERIYDYPAGKLNRDFQYNLISITSSIAQMFNCMVLIRQDKPCVIGLSTNLEVTFHALDCLLHSLWYDYRQLRRKETSQTFSTNFWSGVAEGIREKFRPRPETGRSESGLVIFNKVNQWIQQKYPRLAAWSFSKNDSSSRAGLDEGKNAGSSAQIRPGIRNPSPTGTKLLN